MNNYNFHRRQIKCCSCPLLLAKEKGEKRKEKEEKRRVEKKEENKVNSSSTAKIQERQTFNPELPSKKPQCGFPSNPPGSYEFVHTSGRPDRALARWNHL